MKVEPRDAAALAARPPADARLFLLHGPDAGQAADLAAQLEARLGGERLDLSASDLRDEPGRLADEAAAVSMFGGRSVIRVLGAADGTAEAARYLLEAPAAEHPAILVGSELKPASPLRKLAEAHPLARSVACYPPDQRQFAGLVRELARERGLDADAAAVAMLAAATFPERGVLMQELGKLALYLGAEPARPVGLDPAHVRALGAGEGTAEIDPFIDALAGGDAAAAARHLQALAEDGVSSVTLLRAAQRRLAQLIEARLHVDGGETPEAAAGALRPPLFWKLKAGFVAQLRRWRTPELAAAQSRLITAERALKSAGSPGEIVGQRALIELALRR